MLPFEYDGGKPIVFRGDHFEGVTWFPLVRRMQHEDAFTRHGLFPASVGRSTA
jgi:hypothetical protein